MLRKALVSAVVLVSLSFNAQAVVIDFESTGTPGNYNNLDYAIDGFVFNYRMDNIDISASAPWSGTGPAYSGSFAGLNNWGGTGELTLSGGGTFSFQNLWIRSWYGYSTDANVSGWFNGVEVGSVSSGIGDSWTNIVGNFSNIDSLHFSTSNSGSPSFFLVDNITLNSPIAAVPEPETYAMLLVGLGFLGFTARRRKNFNA